MGVNFKTIDLNYLLELSNGDKQFVTDMLDCFREDVPNYGEKIRETFHANNVDEFKYYVHKLRSPFAFLGVHKGLEILEVLEDAKTIETPEVKALCCDLEKMTQEALSEVLVAIQLA